MVNCYSNHRKPIQVARSKAGTEGNLLITQRRDRSPPLLLTKSPQGLHACGGRMGRLQEKMMMVQEQEAAGSHQLEVPCLRLVT